MSDILIERVESGVAWLTLNRPDRRNALSPDMIAALCEALPRLARDDKVGALVITGAGDAFCAGGDVKAMAEGGEIDALTLEGRFTRLRDAMEISRWLHEMPKPTIAMLPGAAAGAGLSMALACDLRIAVPDAKITTAFIKVAYSGDFGGTYFLTQLVGSARARELYYLGDVITGAEAATLGIVNRVIEADRIADETMALARRIADGPRVTYRYMKKNLNAAEAPTDLAGHLDLEALHHARCGLTEDHREAARAFVEKRAPRFKGR